MSIFLYLNYLLIYIYIYTYYKSSVCIWLLTLQLTLACIPL